MVPEAERQNVSVEVTCEGGGNVGLQLLQCDYQETAELMWWEQKFLYLQKMDFCLCYPNVIVCSCELEYL